MQISCRIYVDVGAMKGFSAKSCANVPILICNMFNTEWKLCHLTFLIGWWEDILN